MILFLKEIITFIVLDIICLLCFLLSMKRRQKICIINLIPNIFSMFIIGPIFLIVGGFTTKLIVLYTILFIVSLGLFISIMYGLCKENKKITILRCVYLFLFIPLLMYISIQQENSHLYARRTLLIIGIIYLLYNIKKVCIKPLSNTNSMFSGLPQHPIRRFVPIFHCLYKKAYKHNPLHYAIWKN